MNACFHATERVLGDVNAENCVHRLLFENDLLEQRVSSQVVTSDAHGRGRQAINLPETATDPIKVTPQLGEPNTSIHEGKVFTCQVRAGRLDKAAPSPTVPPAPWPTRTPIPDTPAAAQPEGQFEHDAP